MISKFSIFMRLKQMQNILLKEYKFIKKAVVSHSDNCKYWIIKRINWSRSLINDIYRQYSIYRFILIGCINYKIMCQRGKKDTFKQYYNVIVITWILLVIDDYITITIQIETFLTWKQKVMIYLSGSILKIKINFVLDDLKIISYMFSC